MIKNVCAECGNNIEIEQPMEEEEEYKGEIDWGRTRMLENSTVSVCNICDPLSNWKRSVETEEPKECNELEPCIDKENCKDYMMFLEGGEEPPCIKLTAKELRLRGK